MLRKVNDTHRSFIANNYAAVEGDPNWAASPEHEGQSFEDYYGDAPRRHAWVAAFRVEQCYGGPEEGGWWYDAGTVEAIIPVMSEEGALKAIEMLESYYEQTEDDTPRWSVASTEGDVEVRFCLNPPKDYPAERPHYE